MIGLRHGVTGRYCTVALVANYHGVCCFDVILSIFGKFVCNTVSEHYFQNSEILENLSSYCQALFFTYLYSDKR